MSKHLMRMFAWLPHPLARPLIRLYRSLPDAWKNPCSLTPTCSAYALEYGIPAAMARIVRGPDYPLDPDCGEKR